MFYKEIQEQTGLGSTFFEHLEAQILKIFLLSTNHGGNFVGVMYGPVWTESYLIEKFEIIYYLRLLIIYYLTEPNLEN